MKFYRYEILTTVPFNDTTSFKLVLLCKTDVVLVEYSLWKETDKGYWVGYGDLMDGESVKDRGKWVPKNSKKKFAYLAKDEALNNFIKRTERKIQILNNQLDIAKIALQLAKQINNA
jgi:hypothetical protein